MSQNGFYAFRLPIIPHRFLTPSSLSWSLGIDRFQSRTKNNPSSINKPLIFSLGRVDQDGRLAKLITSRNREFDMRYCFANN